MISTVPSKTVTVPGMVVIPARNESPSVGDVVREVREHVDWDVVVVDDASDDDTSLDARNSGAQVLRMPFRVGAWGATQTGMLYAIDSGCQLCLTMDADGQHPAEALRAVAEPVVQGVSDLAIGVCPERVSSARHAAWALFRHITGLDLQDITSGMRAYNTDAMQVLTSRPAAMLSYQDIGVLLMLREAGMRASEIKVQMGPRQNGQSRVYDSWWTVAKYLTETFLLSTGKWRPSWHFEDMFVTTDLAGDEK